MTVFVALLVPRAAGSVPLDLSGLKTWVLTIVGTLFIVIFVIRAVVHYAAKDWGQLIGFVVAGIFVAWIVFFSDSAVTTLKNLAAQIFGAG
ncbi:MAG TPA: hypothetical protein VFX70_14865 [Mycobacteriales bacterium]|nr:hypothetical protein [Mycobacteriales bacterium]